MSEPSGQGGPPRVVSDDELKAWLRLVRATGLGPVRLRPLLGLFGSARALCAASPAQWQRAGGEAAWAERVAAVPEAAVEADLAWLHGDPRRHFLTLDDPRYPSRLAALDDAPLALFAVGDCDLLRFPALAVVGSRRPTPGGRELALDFSRTLARHGLAIVSGLALGIDGAAHEGALAAAGATIAVCATGLDRVYPARHRALARRIAESGLLLSEFPPGSEVRAGHFPRRNRIISGLSLGVLVVEAARRSGSLITARLAMEQGREVFAIPGSIHNPLARGCHRLIREGAKLVESAEDVLEELGRLIEVPGLDAPVSPEAPPEDPEHTALLEAMGFDPVSIDQLVARSGLTAEAVSSMLLIMELEGRVASLPGGRYQRLNRKTE